MTGVSGHRCILILVWERVRHPGVDGGAVLAGVKAKPYGWPAASPDPGFGRHRAAAIGTTDPNEQDQIPLKESLRFEGIAGPVLRCLHLRAERVIQDDDVLKLGGPHCIPSLPDRLLLQGDTGTERKSRSRGASRCLLRSLGDQEIRDVVQLPGRVRVCPPLFRNDTC